MKIKVIFLDIDGVLKKVQDTNFNGRNIDNLNELVRKTEAKIVISSTWKNSNGLDFVKKVLEKNGVKADIIGEIPIFKIEDPIYGTPKVPRGFEIQSWIEKNTTMEFVNGEAVVNFIESYVILDDQSDMLLDQKNNFVEVDPTKGFDGKCLKEAIEILNTMIL